MIQIIVVAIIVGAALFFSARRVIRLLKGKSSLCNGCAQCPLKDAARCKHHRCEEIPPNNSAARKHEPTCHAAKEERDRTGVR